MTIDDLLPDWAIGKTSDYMAVGAQLATRDGRRTGNAVVTATEKHPLLGQLAVVVTDVGNTIRMTPRELVDAFHEPKWLMDPATHSGVARAKLEPPCL